MSRRKGEITSAQIDREYPHQVAVADIEGDFKGRMVRHDAIEDFCRGLSRAPLGHNVVWKDHYWHVHCFADSEHAARFKERFEGVDFNPKDRGRGHAWAKWNRKT